MQSPTVRSDREFSTTGDCAGFSPARLQRLSEIERWHFWFVARRQLLAALLTRASPRGFDRLLDVGCGTGTNLELLAAHAGQVAGADFRPEGLERRARSNSAAWLVRADTTRLPFASSSFDAVTALDVLEHVDDEAALSEIYRVLRPGGTIVVTVPAMPWLWSYRDVDAGHLRRYTRRQLLERLRASGFELSASGYHQCLLFPLVLARLARRNSAAARDLEDQPRPVINTVLGWISRAEVRMGRYVSWPFGSSLVALCWKGGHEHPV
jgi:ubiquinone/menaquinone biosynthesis C-methylase UbiE